MDASLIEKLKGADVALDDLAGIFLENKSPDNVLELFKTRGVELTADEARELTTSLEKAKATAELDDDALDDVVGGSAEAGLREAADFVDETVTNARLAACYLMPFLAGCPEMLKKHKSKGY